jgi:hypothetical protein
VMITWPKERNSRVFVIPRRKHRPTS